MTNLPATLDDEAEMFAFAREWIARFREGNFMDLGLAGHAFVRHLISNSTDASVQHGRDCQGSERRLGRSRYSLARIDFRIRPTSRAAACRACCLPDQLLEPKLCPAHKSRGQKKASNIVRDIVFVTLIVELIERFPASELKPTRFQLGRKRQHSACSIVASVLAEAGLYRKGEEAIQKIWKRYSPAVLPGTVAEALLLP